MADQTEGQQPGTQTAQISGTVQIKPQDQNAGGAGKPEEKNGEAPEKKSNRRGIIIAVVVLIALLAGTALAGVVGALVAVPTAALVAVLMDEYLVQPDARDLVPEPAEKAQG